MINRFLLVVCSALALAFPFNASAASFDFTEGGNAWILIPGGEQGAASFSFTVDGLTLTATASGGHNPYLDADLVPSGRPGGLGVCKILDAGDQCAPSSDDNVTYLETLILTFSEEVTLGTTTFNNGEHRNGAGDFSGKFELTVDLAATDSIDLAPSYAGGETGTVFKFHNPNDPTDNAFDGIDLNELQFYIDTLVANPTDMDVIPIPAAAWLFGSALLGLVAVSRRKKVV